MGTDFLAEMGKRILERRKDLRLSQEELAEKAEISKQTVSRAENGLRELGAGNVAMMASALGVSADYLLTGKYTAADVQLLNQKVSGLTPNQHRHLERFINVYIEMCEDGTVK